MKTKISITFAIMVFTICFFIQSNPVMGQKQESGVKKVYETITRLGVSAAREKFMEIKNNKNYLFDEGEFLKLGETLRSFGYVRKSVHFLSMAVELFPQSSVLWQGLGYSNVRMLNKDEAVLCYRKALKFDPKNWRAKEQLQLIDSQLHKARYETREKMRYEPGTNTGLKGPYLGQKLPGMKPELFAPGIVSVYGSNENTVTLTPDGKELYFGKEAGIWVCKLTDEGWTAPENTGFKGYEMWISPTTKKMYYSGYEPGIWVMERIGDKWGNPVRLVKNGMFSTLTHDETLYTTVFKKGANIGRYVKKGSTYTEPEIFGPEVNKPDSFDAHPNVAPDGSFIVYDSNRPEGKGLYITFRKKNGSWSQAKYLGKELSGACSTLSPDGKYLFFVKNHDIYWVDAKIIEQLKPKNQEIFNAVKNNDLEKVKVLIEKDASLVNIKDEAGNTPLHHAAIIGSIETIKLLLSKEADINARNTQLNTPLHEAIQNKKENISALLIEKGADLNKTNIHNRTPLHRAASLNRKGIGKMLIAKGASIDPPDKYQRTPFLIVARHTGDVEFGKLLLNKGANINFRDMYNQMALNLAAWRGFNDFIDFLLDNGAEYDTTRRGSRWMLIFSVRFGSARLFKVVLDKEPKLLSDESFSKSIMHNAIMGGSIEIVNLLLAKNIPLNNDANRYGWTPSHYAALNGHAGMIRFLVIKKLDINQRTLSGKSVYNIAEENNQGEVLKTIKELNGDTSPKRFPRLTGIYLGQVPPAGKPKLFAPDIVSGANDDDNHGSIAFMPDGREIYWNMKKKIWMTKLLNGRWTEPEIASFCEDGSPMDDDNPFITTDGKKMFFTSTRSGSVSERKENIWFVERTSSGWSEPKPISAKVNAMELHWGISVSNSGTLYFGGVGRDNYGMSDIYYSKLVNGVYSKPVNIGPQINNKDANDCPYIAPDESYIIFSRYGTTGGGFYISFKDKPGKWLNPVKLNKHLEGVCPLISPDGRYFFFNSDGIYWMSAKIIEDLKPKDLK